MTLRIIGKQPKDLGSLEKIIQHLQQELQVEEQVIKELLERYLLICQQK